jgi:vacuolar-type H+-ATPase subunit H
MKVLELLDEFESRLEISSSIPFSGKILVDRSEINNLLKEIQLLLPDEIKHAKWIRDDRNNIIEEAKKDANLIVSEAKAREREMLIGAQEQFDSMLDQHKLVELARQKAEQIILKSKRDSEDIRQGAFRYSLEIIEKAHNNMTEVTQLLEKNRNELRSFIKTDEYDED